MAFVYMQHYQLNESRKCRTIDAAKYADGLDESQIILMTRSLIKFYKVLSIINIDDIIK